MKLSDRIEQLYFKKFDDQMDGLNEAEQWELDMILIAVNKIMTPNGYSK